MTNAVSAAVIRDLLTRKEATVPGSSGVLGIKARPEWNGGPIQFGEASVPVVACRSSLAVREALLRREPNRWLVILTDRDDDDLGLGITAHFVGRRLQNPDPWDAVKHGFEATRIDSRLAGAEHRTELATALLNATPDGGWPAARGGVLTFDHTLAAVAAAHLGLSGAHNGLDLGAILEWSATSEVATAAANLTARSSAQLTALVSEWLAAQAGRLGPAVQALLASGRARDLVPLGLVARAVDATASDSGPRALFRRFVGAGADTVPLSLWADAAEIVLNRLIDRGDIWRADVSSALNRADALLTELEARDYASGSTVLRTALTQRLSDLGEALYLAAAAAPTRASSEGPDAVLADPAAVERVEAAWLMVHEHALASRIGELRVPRGLAAVRLVRWLAQPSAAVADFGGAVTRFWTDGAWADRAMADAWVGVDDESLARGLRATVAAARLRRDAHDTEFATLLAAHESADGRVPPGACNAEDLLREVVLPMVAAKQRVLFVLADGMSGSVATEIVDDLTTQLDTWLECVPLNQTTRLAAITAYPSITKVSRASLFCGELAVGEQPVELAGFAQLMKSAGTTGRLFHKLSLDSSDPGFAIAHDVAGALDDQSVGLVACVLNTIDDALDRSDPGGIEWSADAVKHLRPLLERARRAGRVVVLASDHGHIVERREGRYLSVANVSSNRSHGYTGEVLDGEVRVTGRRVLEHNGDAVLAVDERLRYSSIKAGYHGGAAPAEVVIPVCVLATGEAPHGWQFAPPQSPTWWRTAGAPVIRVEVPAPFTVKRTASSTPTLFDTPEPDVLIAPTSGDLANRVLNSEVFARQRQRARNAQAEQQVGNLLRALLATPANRLDAESSSAALGIAVVHLAGALSQVQRLLNVEQYEVIGRDLDGSSIVLDVPLLREQFGIG